MDGNSTVTHGPAWNFDTQEFFAFAALVNHANKNTPVKIEVSPYALEVIRSDANGPIKLDFDFPDSIPMQVNEALPDGTWKALNRNGETVKCGGFERPYWYRHMMQVKHG